MLSSKTEKGGAGMDEERAYYRELGRRIAGARAGRGRSQGEVARALGLAQTTYSGYETGARRLPLDKLQALSAALGVSAPELLGLEQPSLTPAEDELLRALRACPDPAAAAAALTALLRACRPREAAEDADDAEK